MNKDGLLEEVGVCKLQPSYYSSNTNTRPGIDTISTPMIWHSCLKPEEE